MIKADIVAEVVNRTGLSKTRAEMAVETVFETMKRSMERGERIELRGFGVFNIKPRKTGIGRNPRTGEEVPIPPGKAVRFKPGKDLQALERKPSPRRRATTSSEGPDSADCGPTTHSYLDRSSS